MIRNINQIFRYFYVFLHNKYEVIQFPENTIFSESFIMKNQDAYMKNTHFRSFWIEKSEMLNQKMFSIKSNSLIDDQPTNKFIEELEYDINFEILDLKKDIINEFDVLNQICNPQRIPLRLHIEIIHINIRLQTFIKLTHFLRDNIDHIFFNEFELYEVIDSHLFSFIDKNTIIFQQICRSLINPVFDEKKFKKKCHPLTFTDFESIFRLQNNEYNLLGKINHNCHNFLVSSLNFKKLFSESCFFKIFDDENNYISSMYLDKSANMSIRMRISQFLKMKRIFKLTQFVVNFNLNFLYRNNISKTLKIFNIENCIIDLTEIVKFNFTEFNKNFLVAQKKLGLLLLSLSDSENVYFRIKDSTFEYDKNLKKFNFLFMEPSDSVQYHLNDWILHIFLEIHASRKINKLSSFFKNLALSYIHTQFSNENTDIHVDNFIILDDRHYWIHYFGFLQKMFKSFLKERNISGNKNVILYEKLENIKISSNPAYPEINMPLYLLGSIRNVLIHKSEPIAVFFSSEFVICKLNIDFDINDEELKSFQYINDKDRNSNPKYFVNTVKIIDNLFEVIFEDYFFVKSKNTEAFFCYNVQSRKIVIKNCNVHLSKSVVNCQFSINLINCSLFDNKKTYQMPDENRIILKEKFTYAMKIKNCDFRNNPLISYPHICVIEDSRNNFEISCFNAFSLEIKKQNKSTVNINGHVIAVFLDNTSRFEFRKTNKSNDLSPQKYVFHHIHFSEKLFFKMNMFFLKLIKCTFAENSKLYIYDSVSHNFLDILHKLNCKDDQNFSVNITIENNKNLKYYFSGTN